MDKCLEADLLHNLVNHHGQGFLQSVLLVLHILELYEAYCMVQSVQVYLLGTGQFVDGKWKETPGLLIGH